MKIKTWVKKVRLISARYIYFTILRSQYTSATNGFDFFFCFATKKPSFNDDWLLREDSLT